MGAMRRMVNGRRKSVDGGVLFVNRKTDPSISWGPSDHRVALDLLHRFDT